MEGIQYNWGAQWVQLISEAEALEYSIAVAATASDPAPDIVRRAARSSIVLSHKISTPPAVRANHRM